VSLSVPGRAASSSAGSLSAPRDVAWITRLLEDAGFSTWAVGGAVRDALAGHPVGDWDLTTAARPGQVRSTFRRTVPIGIEHGTVGVIAHGGRMYEVTTFRRDVETDGRRARVRFSDTLEEDLERRDFTINAVAWHALTGELRDPHGGVDDLRRGVLRTVGDAAERFREDRLRVLRALRFAGRFGLRVEEGTWEAARAAAPELHHLSAERVREELAKCLRLPHPSTALRLYGEAGVLRELYPELERCRGAAHAEGTVWEHLLGAADRAPGRRVELRLAALLHDVALPDGEAGHAERGAAAARALLRRLRASNAVIDTVVHLVAHHESFPAPDASDAEVRRWVRRVGREHLRDLFRLRAVDLAAGEDPGAERMRELAALLRRVRAQVRGGFPLGVGDLAIGGAELREMGIAPGPRYGEILSELLERATDDPALNDRDALLRLAREMEGAAE
jgi:tRNA nucleotidyltransferase (CCA-adding enzyme)